MNKDLDWKVHVDEQQKSLEYYKATCLKQEEVITMLETRITELSKTCKDMASSNHLDKIDKLNQRILSLQQLL